MEMGEWVLVQATGELPRASSMRFVAGCQYSISSSRPPFTSDLCALSKIFKIFTPLSPSLQGALPSRMQSTKC